MLRLPAASTAHWLGNRLNDNRLNDNRRDNNEYRAITCNLLHLGGHISYAPAAITVTIDAPAPPRLTRALVLLSRSSLTRTRPSELGSRTAPAGQSGLLEHIANVSVLGEQVAFDRAG